MSPVVNGLRFTPEIRKEKHVLVGDPPNENVTFSLFAKIQAQKMSRIEGLDKRLDAEFRNLLKQADIEGQHSNAVRKLRFLTFSLPLN